MGIQYLCVIVIDIPPLPEGRGFLDASQQRAAQGSLTVAPRPRLESGDAPSKTDGILPQKAVLKDGVFTQFPDN